MSAWLKKNKITVLSWPSRSLDLNRIKNLWNGLKIRVGRQQPKTLQQLEEVYVEQWKNIQTEVCANLGVNYRNRLLSVMKNKGPAIDY